LQVQKKSSFFRLDFTDSGVYQLNYALCQLAEVVGQLGKWRKRIICLFWRIEENFCLALTYQAEYLPPLWDFHLSPKGAADI
jgi:hypothetical protein